MVGFENYLAQIITKTSQFVLCKYHVVTSKVKFTVCTNSLCIGFSEICLCPAHNFVAAPVSGMTRYRDPVSHPFVRPIKVLSYSRYYAGASVSYGHISFLVFKSVICFL